MSVHGKCETRNSFKIHCYWIIYTQKTLEHAGGICCCKMKGKIKESPRRQTVDVHHLALRAKPRLVPQPNLSEQQKQRTLGFP